MSRQASIQADAQLSFLIVDDDDVDRMGLKRALRHCEIDCTIVEAHDGIEALDMLREPGRLSEPFIILLDLNMPRMTGIEFLGELRSDPLLRSSIVFVLTTSSDERDRVAAYRHNIAGYIVKRDSRSTFQDTVALLNQYGRLVEFP